MDEGVGERVDAVMTPPEELEVVRPLEVDVGMKHGDHKVGNALGNGSGIAYQSSTAFPTEDILTNVATPATDKAAGGAMDATVEQTATEVMEDEANAVVETEYPTEDTVPLTTAAPTEESVPSKDADGAGGSWMSGLASSMGFGGGADKDAEGDEIQVVDVVEEDVETEEVSSDFPTEETVAAQPAVDAAAMEGEEADAAPGGNVRDKRTPSMTTEMEAFLDDSDEEGGGGAALGVALGLGNGASMPGAADSAAGSAAASTTDMGVEIGDDDEPMTEPSRAPSEDTEFSAGHAKRVIGSGVVLERKASITAVIPELKNKSAFSVEDATATISAGAISERTRKLREEQKALRTKHATERQDTDLPTISAEMSRQGSVKGKSHMYHQALGGTAEKAPKMVPAARRLSGDWTQRRESLEQFVVKYEAPPTPKNAPVGTTSSDGPTRYIPLPADGTSTNSTRIRGGGSIGSGIGIASGGGGAGGSQTGGIAGRLYSDVTEAPVVGSEEVDSAVPGKSASWESRKNSADGTPEEAVAGAGGDADGGGDAAERAQGQVKGESAEGGTDVTSTKTADEEGEERVETADEAVADPVRVARDASSPVLAAAGGTDKTSLGDTGATDVSSVAGETNGTLKVSVSADGGAASSAAQSNAAASGGCCVIS